MMTQKQLMDVYIRACEYDVQAFKPGNVSVYSEGHEMTVNDFILSAEVSAKSITNPVYTLGEKIYYAVKATRAAVGCNTNLGIILLSAPLIQAVYQQQADKTLRSALQRVLDNTSIEDAEWVYKAITLAAPGGLGESKDQDVNKNPDVTLKQAMAIASNKDRIALQYVTNYKDIFEFAILRYNERSYRYDNQIWALVSVFTGLLRQYPDSHIERKYGEKYSEWVLKLIIPVDDALLNTSRPELLIPMLHEVDRQFKAKSINPGTTADLTVATVLIVLMETFSVR